MPKIEAMEILPFNTSTIILFSVVVIGLCAIPVYRLRFHPLSKFPGPKLAAVTRYYEAYYDLVCNGQYTNKIRELHKQYGPIIRISPFELHISDITFFEHLYRFDGRWEKYSFAYDAFDVPNTTICTLQHEAHKIRRASVSPFLSRANVHSRQHLVQQVVDKLFERFDEAASTGTLINLGAAMSAFTNDVATWFLLGKPYNSLARQDFNKDLIAMFQSSGAAWRVSKFIPWYMPLMKSLPKSFMEKMDDPGLKAFLAFLEKTNHLVQKLVETHKKAKDEVGENGPRTIIDCILEADIAIADKQQKRLEDEMGTIVVAAFETTAFASRVILYFLYKNPDILRTLRLELQGLTTQSPPIAELEQLPYLNACIMEGLRFSPGLGTRMARISPDKAIPYGQHEIPAGTPVGMTLDLMHMDEKAFDRPKTFDPDRWLDAAYRRKLEKFHAPFSKGTRMCLGMHLAMLELHVVIAAIVRRYDIDLVDTDFEKDVECVSDQFGIGTKSKTGFKAYVKRGVEPL